MLRDALCKPRGFPAELCSHHAESHLLLPSQWFGNPEAAHSELKIRRCILRREASTKTYFCISDCNRQIKYFPERGSCWTQPSPPQRKPALPEPLLTDTASSAPPATKAAQSLQLASSIAYLPLHWKGIQLDFLCFKIFTCSFSIHNCRQKSLLLFSFQPCFMKAPAVPLHFAQSPLSPRFHRPKKIHFSSFSHSSTLTAWFLFAAVLCISYSHDRLKGRCPNPIAKPTRATKSFLH